MKKSTKKLTKKARPADEAPETPETFLVNQDSGQFIRVFDMGAIFGVEATDGTIHLHAKDRTANIFRRSGWNIVYGIRGFDIAPQDPKAYVTIEEVEEICTELTSDDRERVAHALEEDTKQDLTGHSTDGTTVGTFAPPKREGDE